MKALGLKYIVTVHCMLVYTSDIYGGQLLGVKSVSGLAFFDWESTDLVRRIEIQPRSVSFLIQITNVTVSLGSISATLLIQV